MQKVTLLAMLLAAAALAQTAPLANGVYLIVDGNVKAKTTTLRKYEGRDIVLDTWNFAPLTIAGEAEVRRDANGSSLAVQLAPNAAKRLEELTRLNLDRRIAVVVGDRIVSAPTVRTVITDGQARITPCDDADCTALRRALGQ